MKHIVLDTHETETPVMDTPKFSGLHKRLERPTGSWVVFSIIFLVVALIAILIALYFQLGP